MPIIAEFFVPGTPVPKGSAKAFYNKKAGKAFVVQDNRERQKGWASLISLTAQEKGGHPVSGPVLLDVHFRMPRPCNHYGTGKKSETLKETAPIEHTSRPDLDKLIRCVKDALTGIVWQDDSQVCELRATKLYADRLNQSGAWIRVSIP